MDEHAASIPSEGQAAQKDVAEDVEQLADGRTIRFFSWSLGEEEDA